MRPTHPGVLVGIFVVVSLVSWLLIMGNYGGLPLVPWTAIPTVLLLAVGEIYSGWMTRARIARRPGTKPVEPLAVARLAALAKASAYAGAAFAGIFAGFVLRVMEQLDLAKPRQDAFVAGGSFLCCVLLVGAALYLEYCCRVPKDPGSGPENGRAAA